MNFMNQAKVYKTKRLEAKLTQQDLADKLDIHPQIISNWERGVCEIPKARLRTACKILGVDLDLAFETANLDRQLSLIKEFRDIWS